MSIRQDGHWSLKTAAGARTVNGVRPTSSTYVRPLDERDSSVTVLCVACDDAMLEELSAGLERAGADVTTFRARTSAEAFDVLDAEDVGCVVSPLSAGDVGGSHFLRQVRTKYDDLPFVLMADDGSEAVAADAINAGVDGYVPFEGEPDDATVETLVDRIETVVRDYRSHQRFEDATELLFKLTEYTSDALWMFTSDWSETVVINSAYEDVWGRGQDAVIEEASDFLEGIHPEDRPMVVETMQVLSGGEPADLEFRVQTDDGVEWVSVHAEPVVVDGDVEYVAGFSRDVTRLKEREDLIERVNEATRELQHARSEREVGRVVVDIVESVIDCPITGYWRYEAASETLEPTAASGRALAVADSEDVSGLTTIEDGHAEMSVFREGEPRWVENYDDLTNPSSDVELGRLLLVPLGEHGMVNIGHPEPGAFDDFDRYLVEILGKTATDALDRVERERTLERRTSELETLLNNAPLAFYAIDPDGTIVESRGRGLEALSLDPQDVVGVDIYEMYADVANVREALDRAFAGDVVSETVSFAGRWFENSFVPVFDESGALSQVIGVAFDVTAQKTAEEQFAALSESAIALSDSEAAESAVEQALAIVERVLGSHVAIYWECDTEERRLEASELSDPADVLQWDEDSPLVHNEGDPVWRVYEGGEAVVDNEFAPADTANESPLESMVFAPVEGHGLLTVGAREPGTFGERDRHLVGTLAGLLRSTLDRLENEQELEASRTELERSNESLQQFAYVASHDLQEPLRMVSSYVSLLEAEYGDAFDEEGEEYLHYAVDGATRMQEMIDALLQYSRVHTRGDEFVDVDVETVFEETTQSLAMLVDEADATVHSEDLPRVTADRSQVGQLLLNLVKNAIEYAGPEPTVEVDAVREGDQVHLTVSDDGPGIDDSQHDRIFEIFKSNEGGTGIGLAMCKRIAQRHDGEIWVESEPGAGATFHVTLPAAADGPEAGDPAVGDETSASGIQRTTDGGHE